MNGLNIMAVNNLPDEANIIINGVQLSPAQSMTLRVAIGSFASIMEDPYHLGHDEHGLFMTKMYKENSREIERIIIEPLNANND